MNIKPALTLTLLRLERHAPTCNRGEPYGLAPPPFRISSPGVVELLVARVERDALKEDGFDVPLATGD